MHDTRMMCSDNRSVQKIDVWIIEVGLYAHYRLDPKQLNWLTSYHYFLDPKRRD